MQNNQKIIAIWGAGGFIGKHLLRGLTRLGYRIKVATRNPYLKLYLKPLGNPGQIELFKTNIFNPKEVNEVLNNCDFSINLIGALYENKNQKFNQIHAQFPKLLSELCEENQIKKLIHISALGVHSKHISKYMQSKFEGEQHIQTAFKSSVILRPSVVFGPEDKFFNTFASLTQFSPFLPLIGGGKTKFAPIYVGDVAKAIIKSLELKNGNPAIYELAGPSIYSFRELMEILLKEIKKKDFWLYSF
jgi:Predicted nucleoside-diphosphate-sugar epimerases